MFPYQKSDLCFHVSNTNDEQHVINGVANATNYASDLLNNNNNNNNNTISTNNNIKHWLGKPLENNGEVGNNSNNNTISTNNVINQSNKMIISANDATNNNKRALHRETERQRRQEMANLFSSLRSILPLEYVKGKRSMSDHIFEATKYIKELENNVKELGFQRDHLKKTSSSSSLSIKLQANNNNNNNKNTSSSSSKDNGCNVRIHSFSKAIEIEICTRIEEEQEEEEDHLPLSRVIKVLNEEGLDVVSCVSKKINKRWINVIHCQVDEVKSINICQLQWRLNSEIS